MWYLYASPSRAGSLRKVIETGTGAGFPPLRPQPERSAASAAANTTTDEGSLFIANAHLLIC